MRRFVVWVVLSVLACPVGAQPRRAYEQLHGSVAGPIERLRIERSDPSILIGRDFLAHAEESIRQLEAAFGELDRPIVVRIGSASTTLRIAYDPSEDAISMPRGKGVRNHGLDAWDCLDHELFHAMVGRKFPALVRSEALRDTDVTAIHEGTADYFAWQRDDDPEFGENYHMHGGAMRRYRQAFHHSLVIGSHAKGSAIARHLIDRRTPLGELAKFFAAGEIALSRLVPPDHHAGFGLVPDRAPALTLTLEGHEPSRLHRYRLKGPTAMRFEPNETFTRLYPGATLSFTTDEGKIPRHFAFPGSSTSFTATPTDGEGEKIIVSIHSGGERVGFLVIYLSVHAD